VRLAWTKVTKRTLSLRTQSAVFGGCCLLDIFQVCMSVCVSISTLTWFSNSGKRIFHKILTVQDLFVFIQKITVFVVVDFCFTFCMLPPCWLLTFGHSLKHWTEHKIAWVMRPSVRPVSVWRLWAQFWIDLHKFITQLPLNIPESSNMHDEGDVTKFVTLHVLNYFEYKKNAENCRADVWSFTRDCAAIFEAAVQASGCRSTCPTDIALCRN